MTYLEQRRKNRKHKYKLLRDVGYSTIQANKFKDLTNWKVIKLIEVREDFNVFLDKEYIELDKKITAILKGDIYD